jgi:hypothetical protein
VKQCSDFPAQPDAVFFAEAVYDPLPDWNVFHELPYVPMSWVSSGQNPSCGYGTLLWPFDNRTFLLAF